MQDKIVIDSIEDNKNGGFVIKLNNTKHIATSLHIDFESAINNAFEEVRNFNIKKGEAALEVCMQLAGEEHRKVKTLVTCINGQKIIYKYNNKELTLEDTLRMLNDINVFFRIIAYQYDPEVTEDFKSVVAKVTEIKDKILLEINSLDFTKLKETIYDVELMKNSQLYNIDKELKIKIEKISEIYIKNIEDKLPEVKGMDIEEGKKYLIELLDNKYEEEFCESIEFLNFVDLGIKGFESYNDLLSKAEESYLLYKFNLNNDGEFRFENLYELNINEFINLPMVYKTFVIEALKEKNKKYNTKEELLRGINTVITEINLDDKKSFPL